MNDATITRILISAILLCSSGIALAHPGHHTFGWLASLLHLFTELDHLLAMLVVLLIGVLAARYLLRNSPWKRY